MSVAGQHPLERIPWRLLVPLIVSLAWLLGTVGLFEFGPFEYATRREPALLAFLAAVHVAFGWGYLRGTLPRDGAPAPIPPPADAAERDVRLTEVAVAISLANTVLMVALVGRGDLGNVALALTDPESAYLAGSTKGEGSLTTYVGILVAPFTMIAMTLGVFRWGLLSARWRAGVAAVVAVVILSNVGGATRSGIISTLVVIASALAAALASGRIVVNRRRLLALAGTAAGALLALAAYTSMLAANRDGGNDPRVNPLTGDEATEYAVVSAVLPDAWQLGYYGAAFYFGAPYHRLAMALEMPFEGTGFGLSHSPFLMRTVERFTGWKGLEERSYGMRLDREVGEGAFGLFWSTAYTWYASDVTFPGVVVLVFLLAFALGRAWLGALAGDRLGSAAFACLAFLVFSLPINNPLQDGAGITTYAGIPLAWALLKARQAPSPSSASADEIL